MNITSFVQKFWLAALVFAFVLCSVGHGQKKTLPADWVAQPPTPKKGQIIGMGISDLGMTDADAKSQAYRRAMLMSRLSSHIKVESNVITSNLSGSEGEFELNDRVSYSVEIAAPEMELQHVGAPEFLQKNGAWFCLIRCIPGQPNWAKTRGTVRYQRDVSDGQVNSSITVEFLADSVYISFNRENGVSQYRSDWPLLEETINYIESDLKFSEAVTDWLTPKAKKEFPLSSVDISKLRGHFAPNVGYLQNFLVTVGEIAQTKGIRYILSEDPITIRGLSGFATVTRNSRDQFSSVRIQNHYFAGTREGFQTALFVVIPPN